MLTQLRKALFLLLIITPLLLQSQAFSQRNEGRPTVCLNMIVKNESGVIKRCIDSVLPLIDSWVIVDTGSTDGTQQVIRDYMRQKGLPGVLAERPWVDFAHNRNEAIELGKSMADYLLFIDADEYLQFDEGFEKPLFDKDFYYILISHSGSHYHRIQLANTALPWKWVGVLHEVLCPPPNATRETLKGVTTIYTQDGCRSRDPLKYQKDAQVFEAALEKEPDNSRYVFYLAQSYRDAREYQKAIDAYERRSKMGGWPEEVFWSKFQVAFLKEQTDAPSEEVIKSYIDAFNYRPFRIEPLFHLARHYRVQGNYRLGYQMAKMAMELPEHEDILFNQTWMKRWGAPLEQSICSWWVGNYEECRNISQQLIDQTDLPSDVRQDAEHNLRVALEKLEEKNIAENGS